MKRIGLLAMFFVLFSGSAVAQGCQNADFVVTQADWYSESDVIEIGLANTGSTNLTEFNMTAEAENTEYKWNESVDVETNEEELFLMKKVFTTPVEGLKVDSVKCQNVSAESDVVYNQNMAYEGSLNEDKGNKTKTNSTSDQKESSSQQGGFSLSSIIMGIFTAIF